MAHQGTDLLYGANIIMESGAAGVGVVELDTGAGVAALAPLEFLATPTVAVDWSHRGRRLLLSDSNTNTAVDLPDVVVDWSEGYWVEIANVGNAAITINPDGADTVGSGANYILQAGQVLRLVGYSTDTDWLTTVSSASLPAGPYASIRVTERHALTATLVSESYGSGMTYAWTEPSGDITFGTSTAATTTIVASDLGNYTITLTITDTDGKTDTHSVSLSLDRVLYVGGVTEDSFDTLLEAFTWIDSNDVANDISYTIELNGLSKDTARLVPSNRASVRMTAGGAISCGVDFLIPNTYHWYGQGGEMSITSRPSSRIYAATGHAVTIAAGVVLRMSDIFMNATDGASSGLYGTAGTYVQLYRCGFATGGLYGIYLSGGIPFRIYDSVFTQAGIYLSGNPGGIPIIRNCFFIMTSNLSPITLVGWQGLITNCQFHLSATTGPFHLISVSPSATAASLLSITGCMFRGSGSGAGILAAVKIIPGGTGSVRVNNNSFWLTGANSVGVHFVGAMPTGVRLSNNSIESVMAAILSTSDDAGAVALPLANAPFYGNAISGPITNVTFATGTMLSGGNIQV